MPTQFECKHCNGTGYVSSFPDALYFNRFITVCDPRKAREYQTKIKDRLNNIKFTPQQMLDQKVIALFSLAQSRISPQICYHNYKD